jgi:transcriptional antiterminator RfaH
MSTQDLSRWYVVQCRPQQETRAECNLRRFGLDTLLPKVLERAASQRATERAIRPMPLFPGYLFARFDAFALLSSVRFARGVRKVVCFGGSAVPLDDAVITFIRSRIRDDGFVRINEPCPGEIVEIIDGPLRSLAGVFERQLTAKDRVVILLGTITSQTRVEVHKDLIRRADVQPGGRHGCSTLRVSTLKLGRE